MEDYKIIWYILAAVVYFLTRSKKKKAPAPRPGTENNPPKQAPAKSFEDLLKEITGEALPEEPELIVEEPIKKEPKEPVEEMRLEGERRAFADEESRRVYEESIKRAEGFDIEYKPDEHYREPRIFKEEKNEEAEYTFADEIRDGLNTTEAKKAVIYSEILARKY
ncbi:MAG: hypothetical protein RIM99_09180 [Cyclobacteriaceae bacterium]